MGKYIIVDGPNSFGAAEIGCALAVYSGFTNQGKCLLINSGIQGEGIEMGVVHNHKKIAKGPLSTFKDTGMSSLARLSACGRLSTRNFRNYTLPLIENRLDLAPGYHEADRYEFHPDQGLQEQIWNTAAAYYERVYIGGMPLEEALLWQEPGDIVIVVLRQNRLVLDQLFEMLGKRKALSDSPIIIVIHHYDELSSLSTRNLRREYGKHYLIIGVPYSSSYANAWNQSETLKFLQRNLPESGSTRTEYGRFVSRIKQLDEASRKLSSSAGTLEGEREGAQA